MYKNGLFLFFILLSSCTTTTSENNPNSKKIRAADISYLPLIESTGAIFKHKNQPQDVVITLKNAGCNYIRIRLWYNPADAHSGLQEVTTLAARVRNSGLKVWLTVHYSDTFADPGSQTKPVAWQNLSLDNLKVQVANYTSLIMDEISPEIFQIGNETNDGFLWPEGKLSSNENQYLQLVKTASLSIRNKSASTKIMLHFAGFLGSDYYYNKVKSIDYDYIGLSYYPVFHGKDLNLLDATISNLAMKYNKKVLVAETAYPFTLGFNDFTNNIVGLENQLISGFPASEMGQKNYLLALKNRLNTNPNSIGFCYWEPEWIAFRGTTATNGSAWENQALWDFNSNSLEALQFFSN